jgi:sialidase-1
MTLAQKMSLTLIKRAGQLILDIDGQPLGSFALSEPMSGKFGIYPAKGMCRIFDFSAEGDLVPLPAEKPFIHVFERGENDYNTFRIPAVQALGNQRLLAFAEGRRKSRSDYGEIDIVMKVSRDNGLNWGKIQVVAGKHDSLAYNSPCLLFEPEANRLHLFCNHDRHGFLHYWSDDQGDHWSDADTVQLQGGMPYYPKWRFFVSPGKGLLLRQGTHAGRWVIPGYYQFKNEAGQYLMHAVVAYKDPDLPWQLAEAIDTSLDRSNECTAVELENGMLMMNIRTQDQAERYRWQALSSDGGASWSQAEAKEELVDPICHASMISLPVAAGNGTRLLFANPSNPLVYHRTHLTVRLSRDQGTTWPENQLIYEGPSAYSAMALVDKDSLVILFEMGYHYNYERIVMETLPLPD